MLDSSFNPELVVLHLDDFQYLANEVYPEGETSRVLKEAKKLSKESNSKEITWKDVMGWVVQGAISGVTSGITTSIITNLTPLGIINTLKKVFNQTK